MLNFGSIAFRLWVPALLVVAQSASAGEKLVLRSGVFDLNQTLEEFRRGRSGLDWLKLGDFSLAKDDAHDDGDDDGDLDQELLEEARTPRNHRAQVAWVGTKEKRPKRKADAKRERYYVVQMHERIAREDLANLESFRLESIRYLPEDALVVKATARKIQVLAKSSPRIRAITPFLPAWKIAPEFGASSIFSGDPEVQAVVQLFPGEDAGALARALAGSGKKSRMAEVQNVVIKARRAEIKIKRSRLWQVAELEAVEWIEPANTYKLAVFEETDSQRWQIQSAGFYDDLTGTETGTKLVKLEAAWSRGWTGKGELVAVADTGLDRGQKTPVHEDFIGRIANASVHGMFSKSWEDPSAHGTHVAGLVGGSGAAAAGGPRPLAGAAPEVALMPQSLWSPKLGNMNAPADMKGMFQKAYASGARIHTNSWGSIASTGVYDSMAQQVDEFTRANPDFLVLFAAGNAGEDADFDGRIDAGSVQPPATAKNALTVGASKNLVKTGGLQMKMIHASSGRTRFSREPIASSEFSENDRGLAAFSSRGPTADGRLKPEIVAPGTNILAARSRHPAAGVLWGAYNQDYVWSGGTSMATPLVAGAAAVVRGYLINDRKFKNPSAALVKAVLLHTAEDLFPGQFGSVGAASGQEILSARPNSDEGFGRVDADRATDLKAALLVDESKGLLPSETHVYPIQLSRASTLEATLVYTDPPAALAATSALVNDLDVTIVDASGRRHAISDRLNNHEHLLVNLPAGAASIEVRGVNVPLGPQSYALVVSPR